MIQLPEMDRRALVAGMTLHNWGSRDLEAGDYAAALAVRSGALCALLPWLTLLPGRWRLLGLGRRLLLPIHPINPHIPTHPENPTP